MVLVIICFQINHVSKSIIIYIFKIITFNYKLGFIKRIICEENFFGLPSRRYSSAIGLQISNNIEAKIKEKDSLVTEPRKVTILNNLIQASEKLKKSIKESIIIVTLYGFSINSSGVGNNERY